jgi:hypothetical protein
MITVRHLPLAAAIALCHWGCGEPETLVFESGPIPLTATAPLFEGSNTAQAAWSPGLEAFLQQHGAVPDDVRSARVVAAHLSGDSLAGLQGIRSASLMVASDARAMQQLAVLNPLPAGQQQVDLTIATDQQGLAGHLRQSTVTLLTDLDLSADSDSDRHVIGSLAIELQLKK